MLRREGRFRAEARAVACAALAVGAAAVPVAAAPATGDRSAAAAKLRNVAVGSDFYDPHKLSIRRGDRVRWSWESGSDRKHDVYVKRGPERFHSPTQSSGTYTRRFRKAGRFRLYCTQHTMFMTLTVRK
jgi:plastocyanin